MTNSWEEEFDEKYHIDEVGAYSEQLIPNSGEKEPIKDFIRNLLQSEIDKKVEEILLDLRRFILNRGKRLHNWESGKLAERHNIDSQTVEDIYYRGQQDLAVVFAESINVFLKGYLDTKNSKEEK